MPAKKRRKYKASALREAISNEPQAAKYRAEIRDLARYPIAPPPKRPRVEDNPLWLLLADAHFPFVDPATWQIVQWACRDLKPSGLVIMGDWGDFGTITQHEKSPDAADSLLTEFASGDEALDVLDAAAPTAWFRKFLRGNHEYRVDRFLASNWCPGALKSLIPSVERGYHLEARGYEYIADKPDTLGTDHLFLHGHFYSKHHASRHLEALWHSTVYGHTHCPAQATHSSPNGMPNRVVAVATGLPTMRSLIRDWHEEKRVHNWVNGFGVMEFSATHAFAHNIYVIDGQAAYGRCSWDASHLMPTETKRNARLQP